MHKMDYPTSEREIMRSEFQMHSLARPLIFIPIIFFMFMTLLFCEIPILATELKAAPRDSQNAKPFTIRNVQHTYVALKS